MWRNPLHNFQMKIRNGTVGVRIEARLKPNQNCLHSPNPPELHKCEGSHILVALQPNINLCSSKKLGDNKKFLSEAVKKNQKEICRSHNI